MTCRLTLNISPEKLLTFFVKLIAQKKIVPDNLYPGLNQGASTISILGERVNDSGRFVKMFWNLAVDIC